MRDLTFDRSGWREIAREDHVTPDGLAYSYVTLTSMTLTRKQFSAPAASAVFSAAATFSATARKAMASGPSGAATITGVPASEVSRMRGTSGNFAQEGRAQFFRRLARAAMAEDVMGMAAIGADEHAHILDHAQDRHLGLLEHGDALAGVDQGDVLRRGDDHRAFQRHALGDGELGVAGARRHVQHQHVQRRPAAHRSASGSAPICTIGPRQIMASSSLTRKPMRHGLEAVFLDRLELLAVAFRLLR